jgi:hypothetical protein
MSLLLKKSLILIHSASFSHVAAPCGCPVLDADAHSPRWCCAPHPLPLVRTPSCALPAPSCRYTGVGGARAARPTDPSPVLVVVVLDASGARGAPLTVDTHPMAELTDTCSVSHMLQIYVLSVSDVLGVYCSCFIWMLQK